MRQHKKSGKYEAIEKIEADDEQEQEAVEGMSSGGDEDDFKILLEEGLST